MGWGLLTRSLDDQVLFPKWAMIVGHLTCHRLFTRWLRAGCALDPGRNQDNMTTSGSVQPYIRILGSAASHRVSCWLIAEIWCNSKTACVESLRQASTQLWAYIFSARRSLFDKSDRGRLFAFCRRIVRCAFSYFNKFPHWSIFDWPTIVQFTRHRWWVDHPADQFTVSLHSNCTFQLIASLW